MDEHLLIQNGMVISNLHGICECGAGFHFSVSERILEKLLEDAIERKKTINEFNNSFSHERPEPETSRPKLPHIDYRP